MRARLLYIDGLKGLCAICIFMWHYYQYICYFNPELIPLPLIALFEKGWLAVELFFMLSGFLMASKYTGRQMDTSFKEYMSSKLWRIMPCFLLSNFVIVLLAWINQWFVHSNLLSTVDLWGIVSSCLPFNTGWIALNYPYNTPGWFISVLFLNYTIYFYILKIKNRHAIVYMPLCIIMIFLGMGLLELNCSIPFLYSQTARGYLCFFAGVLLKHLFDQKFNKHLISVLGMGLIGLLIILIHKYGVALILGNVRYSCIFVIFPLLILVITEFRVLQKILSCGPVLYFGKMSMSVFLMHWPVMQIIRWFDAISGGGIDPSSAATFGIILLIVLSVSACEYEICEKRLFPYCIPKIASTLKKDN